MSRRFAETSSRHSRSTALAPQSVRAASAFERLVARETARPWLRLLVAWSLLAGAGIASARAGLLGQFFSHDIDVIAVTDVTDAGKGISPPSSLSPVRYTLVYVGETNFGRSWAGETTPTKHEAIKWIVAALKSQGYLLADKQHEPDVAMVFGWGMLGGGPARTALGFLGGTKVDLMWLQQSNSPFSAGVGGLEPRLLMQNAFTSGLAGKVWDYAASDLFLGVVRCYTKDSVYGDKATKLWETRFACPATGLSLKNCLPLMIRAAAPSFGRDTARPVNINATDRYVGHVVLGDLRVLEDDEPSLPPPSGPTGQPAEKKSPPPPGK